MQREVLEIQMAVNIDQSAQALSNDQEDISAYQYTDDYKNSLLQKLFFLLENVAPEHKNILITSKIANMQFEKFDRARSLVEGSAYFRQFLTSLDVLALEKILVTLKPGLELNSSFNPRTANAYMHVYHAQPVQSAQFIIEQAFDAFGNKFSSSLEKEIIRQQQAAIAADPAHMLEHNELQQCKEYNVVFKEYIPKIPDPVIRGKFVAIIRKTLRDPFIGDDETQLRLRFAAQKLAEALENAGNSKDAYALRALISSPEYRRIALDQHARLQESKDKTAQNRPQPTMQARPKPFLDVNTAQTVPRPRPTTRQSLLERFKNSMASLNPLRWFKSEPAKVEPFPPLVDMLPPVKPTYDPAVAKRMRDLSEKIYKLQNPVSPNAADSLNATNPVTFAFDARNKKQNRNILPEMYGPHKPKPYL